MQFSEPTIRVGQHTLSTAQVMTVRVAHNGHVPSNVTTKSEARKMFATVLDFKTSLAKEGLGEDETGTAIAEGYVYHAAMVLALLQVTFGPLGDP